MVMDVNERRFDQIRLFSADSVRAPWHRDFARLGLYDVFGFHARLNEPEIRLVPTTVCAIYIVYYRYICT